MKKRYIYIVVIIVVLIGICLTEQILVKNYLNNMETRVTEITEEVKNLDSIKTPEIYNKVVELEQTWDGYETTLCFLVNLKDIEDIGIEITKMKVYVVEDNIVEFKASLALILYFIDSYHNVMGISFENIF